MGQTNEQQRHFNEWPISELHRELDSSQTSLKLLFNLQQEWNVVSVFQLSKRALRHSAHKYRFIIGFSAHN
jgi:hypothetical protein